MPKILRPYNGIALRKKSYLFLWFFSFVLFCSSFVSISTVTAASAGRFDVVYLWDNDLNSVLEYKEELENLLGTQVSKKLKLVAKGDQYGVVYDTNGSSLTAARIAVHHSEVLRKADLAEATAVNERSYHNIYNVSYGLGRNLDSLKKTYAKIYRYMGREVGKKLYIEKTDSGNYTLIYRRRGDKKSTAVVARRHSRILRRIKLKASITLEDNNEVVFGESSLLDIEEEDSPPPPVIADKGKDKHVAGAVGRKTRVSKKILAPKKRKVARKKSAIRSLHKIVETRLEEKIESYIEKLRRRGQLAADEKTGWFVYDFTRGANLVDINVSQPMQAASMIKPFVALAFFHRVKEGRIKYGPKSRRKMAAMIQRSSNPATNWVLKHVGGPVAAQKILNNHYGNLFNETRIVEYIPAGGRTYKNQASPGDYGRFLKALWQKKLPYTRELRRLMALPGRDRLYSGTPIPQGTLVYNKTGTTAHLCGDMGILVPRGRDGRRYPYTIVGIIEKQKRPRNYGRWKIARSNLIRKVSSMVYNDIKAYHNL